MNEIFQSKKAAVMNRTEGEKLDLMIAMIKGAGITPENLEKGKQASPQSLSDQEILANAFIFMVAGHETTANAIHFCLVVSISPKHGLPFCDDSPMIGTCSSSKTL